MVRDPAGRDVEVSGPRQRALVVRLALDAGRAVPAERLIGDLWEGAPPATAGNALQAVVSRLRAAGLRDLIEHGPYGYRLTVASEQVDAKEFERRVAAARAAGDPAERAAGLRAALRLWRGQALADVADREFAAGPIAWLEELRLAAIEDRIDADLVVGRGAELVPELEGLAAEQPMRERLRGLLMRALVAAGRPADALVAYEQAREVLADRLGIDPSAELAELHLAILRGDEGQRNGQSRQDVPPPARRTNLPAQLTSFVGREDEVERVGKLLRESRLVTLTGPGGAGKTRLATESAVRLVNDFPDGVWFVSLASAQDEPRPGRPGERTAERSGNKVAQAVLVAMGIPETARPGETRTVVPRLDRLADVLAVRRTLLIMDNCEHLLDAVAEVVGRVLAEAPGVRVLATSREPLGITGESLCPVPSLALPPPDVAAPEAAAYAAVRLFADRASAVRPGFVVDGGSVGQVVAICRALDGIPLAIELAAARLRSLSPAQIVARLDDRFKLLSGGSRTALPRHQTLRAVVEWSWDLLNGTERAVLRRLSVFAGGATPDAAEQVCSAGPGAGTVQVGAYEVVDVIAALVDKSLVIADGAVEVRYRLLETVRAFAAEQLGASGEQHRVRSAHAAYFLELAERADPELRAADQLLWADRLLAERDNHAAAFRHLTATRDVGAGLRLVGALFWFWVIRDMENQAAGWAREISALVGDVPPEGLTEQYALCLFVSEVTDTMGKQAEPTPAKLREMVGRLLPLIPDVPRIPMLVIARPMAKLFVGDGAAGLREARRLADHPDPWVRAALCVIRGMLAFNAADLDTATAEAAQAHEAFSALGDRFGKILALGSLRTLAEARGDVAQAVRLAEDAYELARSGVNAEQGAGVLIQLGRARAALADPAEQDRARAELRQGIMACERIAEHGDAAGGLLALSELDRRTGDLAGARAELRQALERVETHAGRVDVQHVAAAVYGRMGCLTEQEGDLAEAASWHARALRLLREDEVMDDNQTLAGVVEGVAALAAARGQHEHAAELLGTAHALHGFRNPLSYDVERTVATCEAALGRDGFEAAYGKGRRATRADALALQI